MGKSKFTAEEGQRILTFVKNWRKKNPNATEWPLKEIQQDLKMSNYSRDQIRNKIASLQKSEKIRGSQNYNVLCLRQTTPKPQKNNETRVKHEPITPVQQIHTIGEKLPVIKNLFLIVEPSQVINGWFQLHLHEKTTLGSTVGETWDIIIKNWERIKIGLPAELDEVMQKMSRGKKPSDLPGKRSEERVDEPEDDNSMALTPYKRRKFVFDSSSDDEFNEPFTNCANRDSVSPTTPNVSTSTNFLPTEASVSNLAIKDISFSEVCASRPQVPFKYLIANGWTVPKSNELEPTCSIFGQNADRLLKPEERWPVLIQAILRYPNFWSKVTENDTWKDILNQTKFNCNVVSTKMEFFRDILTKRDTFFEMRKTKMETLLTTNQPEALNLVFYSILNGKNFAEFQRLYDDCLLDHKVPWFHWIFILKARLNQNDAKEFFGVSDTSKAVVNERLYSLIFNDGMALAYNTANGKHVVERLIRTIYAAQSQF